ncbi:hypothetical protein [Xenorhabdus bovienii]|uniref:hypothetical protein n=1 Tax=Xenorhabdus bovienii TaxID=40576 RepID=UPI0023B3320C|nr:hypothetical protein [Xenorhabdus bovienii]MDE9487543.1 hypothetical protein [Xenorhabdus bovienii]
MTDKKETSLDQLSLLDKEAVRSKKTLMLDINFLDFPKELNIRYAGLGYDEYWEQPHVKVNNLPIEIKKLIRQKKLTVAKALSGDKPKRYTPPKKTVSKILDIVAEAHPEINGDVVNVSIPLELYKQLFDPNIDINKENQED